jgi:hypothetical protein
LLKKIICVTQHQYFKKLSTTYTFQYIDENGYNHIQFLGPKYFTVRGNLSELSDKYVINCLEPTVSTHINLNTHFI